jgi:hypothetical protein
MQKLYATPPEAQKRCSPPECVDCTRKIVTGNPAPEHVSTSCAGRANLTLRTHMRQHQTRRVSPPMEAGVTDRLWELADVESELCKREATLAAARARRA